MIFSTTPTQNFPSIKIAAPKAIALGLLNWIVSKDQNYRANCHMQTLTDEQLKDAGLTR